MPVITVSGIPEGTSGLADLIVKIQDTVASVSELEITSNMVTVFCPKDLVQEGLGEEIIVDVQKLDDKPERTAEVLDKLATKLAELVVNIIQLHQLKFVEVFVQCFGSVRTGFKRIDR